MAVKNNYFIQYKLAILFLKKKGKKRFILSKIYNKSKVNICKKSKKAFSMPYKILENNRTNKIILYVILTTLIITSVILISMIVVYYVSLEDTGGG
jgi:hypothetical protein